MVDAIYKNNNFIVKVGESSMLEGAQVYHAVNIYTGVIESEDTMLPRIIEYADQLDLAVEELIASGKLKDFVPRLQ